MAKRFTDSEKWKRVWFRDALSIKYKMFWIYILDMCNHAGIWIVDWPLVKFNLKEDYDPAETKAQFIKHIIDKGNKWVIKDFIEFQYGVLNDKNRTHNSVINILKKEGAYKLLVNTLQGATGTDKGTDTGTDKGTDTVKDKRVVKTDTYIKNLKENPQFTITDKDLEGLRGADAKETK